MENIKKVLFGKALTVLLVILFVPSIGFSEVKKKYYDSGELKTEHTYKIESWSGSNAVPETLLKKFIKPIIREHKLKSIGV